MLFKQISIFNSAREKKNELLGPRFHINEYVHKNEIYDVKTKLYMYTYIQLNFDILMQFFEREKMLQVMANSSNRTHFPPTGNEKLLSNIVNSGNKCSVYKQFNCIYIYIQ